MDTYGVRGVVPKCRITVKGELKYRIIFSWCPTVWFTIPDQDEINHHNLIEFWLLRHQKMLNLEMRI